MRGTLFYGSCMMLERVSSFFLLPLLAKSVSPDDYVVWSQSVIAAGILTPIVLLGFPTAIVRFWPRWGSPADLRMSMLARVLLCVSAVLAVVAVAVACAPGWASGLLYGQAQAVATTAFAWVGLLVGEAAFELLTAVMRTTDRIHRIAIYGLAKGVIRIALLVAFLRGSGCAFPAAFVGYVSIQLVMILVICAIEVPVRPMLRAGLSAGGSQWRETISFAFPLVAMAMLIGANNACDRFVLVHLRPAAEVASYSAALSLVGMAAFVYSVLGFTLFPALTRCWESGRKDQVAALVSRVLMTYLLLLLPFIGTLVIAGDDALGVLATSSYHVDPAVFLLLGFSIGAFGVYQIFYYVLLLAQGGVPSLWLMGGVVAFNVVANIALVPILGLYGAAGASCASNVVLALMTARMSRRALAIPIRVWPVVRLVMAVVVLAAVAAAVSSRLHSGGAALAVQLTIMGAGMTVLGLVDSELSWFRLLRPSVSPGVDAVGASLSQGDEP